MLQRQKDLEAEMVALGVRRFREDNRKAKKGKHESTTPAGVQFLRKGVAKVEKRVNELKKNYSEGTPYKYPTDAVERLFELPSDVISFLSLKACVNHLSTPVKLVKVANELGSFLEDEARFRFFKDSNPALYGVIMRDLNKRTTNYRKQKRVLVHSSNKAGIEWKNWLPGNKVRLGQMMVELVCEATKLFKVDLYNNTSGQKRKSVYWLEATEESLKWIDKKNSICELYNPVKLPCLIPPRKWDSVYSGGYYTYTNINLVKTMDHSYLEMLDKSGLKEVKKAVNIVQETGWRINKKVFEVMDSLFNSRSSCKVIPEFLERTMPHPYPKKGTKEEQIEWKRLASLMHADNVRLKTKRIQFSQLMWTTRKFKDEKVFYFPHTIDFRGRMYANTAFLNPQGEDSARGLLEFSVGKPLGDSGLPWLQVHLANCYGFDKVSLEERVEWAKLHNWAIVEVGTAPLINKWWMEADKPWQFLRACSEYVKYKVNPKNFVSHLPITVDGSCNGLQHFSAMLRDEVGGKAVNLTMTDDPRDIYEIVKEKVVEKVKADPEAIVSDLDINRALVKRPVMTTPYGATLYGMREQIYEELKKQLDKGIIFTTISKDKDLWVFCKYLATIIYESIGEVVVSAREGMAWLQECARVLSKDSKPIYWTVPTGFIVKQKYLRPIVKEVKTIINGKMASLFSAHGVGDKLDKHKQTNGIAPNYVHSMDACHLMKTVNLSYTDIQSFSVVHDSFGTHACDMELLSENLRTTFIEIYKEDVLKKFAEEQSASPSICKNTFPKIPKYGKLNIKEVKDAEFFFS
jgi:DNA-directed RNA polymerase